MPNIKTLNRVFPFAIGVSPFLIGSFVTILYFTAFFSLLTEFVSANYKLKLKHSLNVYKLPVMIWVLFFGFAIVPLYWRTDLSEALFITGSYLHFMAAPFVLIGLYLRNAKEDYLILFIKGLRLGLIIVFVVTLVQFGFENERPSAFMGNTLVLATISLLGGFAAMTKLPEDTKQDRALALAGFICATLIIFMTNARSMILAWPVLMLMLTIHLARAGETFKRLLLFIGIILIAVMVLFVSSQNARDVFAFRVVEPIEKVLNNEQPEESIQFRIDLLKNGWIAFKEKPLSGYGISNTMDAAIEVAQTNNLSLQVTERTHLHNDYLNHLVGGGIPLAILFVLVLTLPIWIARKASIQPMQSAIWYFASITSVGFGLSALTNLVFGHDILQSYFLISCIFICLTCSQKAKT